MDPLDRRIQAHLNPSFNLGPILAGETSENKDGFAIISERSFDFFRNHVPHLFHWGQQLLNACQHIESSLDTNRTEFTMQEVLSIKRALSVIETITKTANITAPTDLWLLHHVLSSHREIGLSDTMLQRKMFTSEELVAIHELDREHLDWDLSLLHSRGLLEKTGVGFQVPEANHIRDIYQNIPILVPELKEPVVFEVLKFLESGHETPVVKELLKPIPPADSKKGWTPDRHEIETGFRVVPLILAVHHMPTHKRHFPALAASFALDIGFSDIKGTLTSLGERVLERGPGPFGIIHAYHAYMKHHLALLRGNREKVWVSRAENVAASQDANRKTFTQINNSLDLFCKTTGFTYNVFIEHAVGRGEACRQRFKRSGEVQIQYFGADLEDRAIDSAIDAQKRGELPSNMKFIRKADIGRAEVLISGVTSSGHAIHGAVMVVGNGFHEVRQQTNDRMIQIFKSYCDAGIVLIFTEESSLTDENLLDTAWNTYHAGFRYVHSLSGQGLRPAYDEPGHPLLSWEACASKGGYQVIRQFCSRTRTIYPHPRPDGKNPAISVNYFCVPPSIIREVDKKSDAH